MGDRNSTTWPKGYRVRFSPTELIDPTGRVVASEGDEIWSGGGWSPSDSENPKGILMVQGWPQRVSRARLRPAAWVPRPANRDGSQR
jgi:hypothetical protein